MSSPPYQSPHPRSPRRVAAPDERGVGGVTAPAGSRAAGLAAPKAENGIAPLPLPQIKLTRLELHHTRVSPLDRVLARPDLLVFGAILLGAFVIRIWNLGNFPDTFSPDEADNTEDALRIIHGMPPQNGFFGFDWKPQPAYSAYLLSFFLRIFGVSIFAARLPSALISTLALIPFYFLLRRLFSIITSLISTFLLATNLWYLNFSRSGWENIHVAFYMLMTMLFLLFALDGLRKKSIPPWWVWLCFAASGFGCALGLYGYFGGRAIILAVIAYFPIALWFYHRRWGRLLGGYIVVGIVAALLIWPLLAYTIQHWDFFNQRSKAVLIMNTPEYLAHPIGTIMNQIGRNVRGFWFGDNNHTARYTPDGQPLLDTFTGILFFGGMMLSFAFARLRRHPETYLWWLMLVLPWTFTEILTYPTPDGARGAGWMPAIFFFIAVGVEGMVLLSAPLQRARWVGVAVTIIAMLGIGFTNLSTYARWQMMPATREVRAPYIANCEFSAWSAQVIDRAEKHLPSFTVSDWLVTHPRSNGAAFLPCDANGEPNYTVAPHSQPQR